MSIRWRRKVRLYDSQDGMCCYCDGTMTLAQFHQGPKPLALATFEHLLQKVDGGTMQLDNIKLACSACNSARPNGMPSHFYRKMRQGLLDQWPCCAEPTRPIRRAIAAISRALRAPERIAA